MTTNLAQESMVALYDKWMVHPLHAAFFGHSDYYNYGYSTSATRSQSEACENLVEELLRLLPDKSGSILDVACGLGASTRHLLTYYAPENVTAINISEAQLARAAQNAPGCRFLKMDAARLDFPDASFDNIICVESAFHFQTREQFFREALRVLKPGGRLVMSDILGWMSSSKRVNYLENPAAHDALLARVGFEERQVLDVTEQCLRRCGRRLRHWPSQEWHAGRLTLKDYVLAQIGAQAYAAIMRYTQHFYLIAAARKPY